MSNPLEQYFRSAKLYVKLPSRGQFYPSSMIETTANQEIAVYPMSALDQIIIRTPDALLNGDALVKIVGNCVPSIKDVKNLVEPDINTLILAIRIASVGHNMEITIPCPSCNHENTYQIDLTAIIETQKYLDDSYVVDLDGELLIYLRPYNFNQRNLTLLNEIQQTQAIGLLESNKDLDETAKFTELGKCITSMAQRTFDIVAKSITQIRIVKTGMVVTEEDYIQEFLQKISKVQADAIMHKLKELNTTGIDNSCHFICNNCSNEWDHNMDFDPSSFFA